MFPEAAEDPIYPQDLFPQSLGRHRRNLRFVNRTNNNEILIYTDGACLGNGYENSAGGFAFVFNDDPRSGTVSGRLENRGPTGQFYQKTSNRAELRAVIAALQFRCWYDDGRNSLVIATDSEYVAKGATDWIKTWLQNSWVTSQGIAVRNRDLWELLLQTIQDYEQAGMEVSFWRIPRELNRRADLAAKEGAQQPPLEYFQKIVASSR